MKRLLAALLVSVLCPFVFAQKKDRDETRPIVVRLIKGEQVGSGFTLFANDDVDFFAAAGSPVILLRYNVIPGNRNLNYLKIRNTHAAKVVAEVKWEVEIFEPTRKMRTNLIYQTAHAEVKPGQAKEVKDDFPALIGSKVLILARITKVIFQDGSEWTNPLRCSLDGDYARLECR